MPHAFIGPKSYAEALTLLGGRASRKIGHNTYLERNTRNTFGGTDADAVDAIGVRLHSTYVVTFVEDGTVAVRPGTFSMTTARRIRGCLPTGYTLAIRNRLWSIVHPGGVQAFSYGVGTVILSPNQSTPPVAPPTASKYPDGATVTLLRDTYQGGTYQGGTWTLRGEQCRVIRSVGVERYELEPAGTERRIMVAGENLRPARKDLAALAVA